MTHTHRTTRAAISWLGSGCPRVDVAHLVLAGFSVLSHRSVAQEAALAAANKRDVTVVVPSPTDPCPESTLRDLVSHAGRGFKIIALLARRADIIPALDAGVSDALASNISAPELEARIRHWLTAAERERQQDRALTVLRHRNAKLEATTERLAGEVAALSDLSHNDPLTGMIGRVRFVDELHYVLAVCGMYGGPVALIAMDIDDFGRMNTARGRGYGDSVLRRIANLLRGSSRRSDLPARISSERFALLLPATDLLRAGRVAERMRTEIERYFADSAVPLTASFGVAAVSNLEPRGQSFADRLLREADAALRRAKRQGRNRVVINQNVRTEAA